VIELFSGLDVHRLRAAGRAAARTLDAACRLVQPGMATSNIDQFVRQDTQARGGTPSQLGFQGFPAAVCTSRNHVVCHGIPSENEHLETGDIVNIDVTTELDGFHGDTSRTVPLGSISAEAERLLRVAEECMHAGISVIREGARLGDIGAAILETASRNRCSVVRELCGHGIGRSMHTPPLVAHVGQAGRGLRLKAGMALTVEPMINLGQAGVVFENDGWTVTTADGSLSAQFEHTVLVTKSGFEILTIADSST
jgi:methionyl aminopeptidase